MKAYVTRSELLELVPNNSKIVEIGVFKGEFADQIYALCSPKELYLVDIWRGKYGSGDKDGKNHIDIEDMQDVYLRIFQKTKHIPEIKIVRSESVAFLRSCEANYFDAIYVDGDHTAQAVYNDLVNSYRVLKNEGFLMGHDFHYTIGGEVAYAVKQFCDEFNQNVIGVANDGCPSFLIKVEK